MKKASATRSSPAAKNSKKKAAGAAKVATPKKGTTAAGTTTPKKGHPTFAAMVCEAIADIEGTVSRPAIAKWIKDHYEVNEAQFALHLKNGLAKLEEEGKLVKVKASYKLKTPKKSKESSTVKKAASKRKITTPKAKKPSKKRRTEKESDSERPDEEGQDDEEEQSSHEMESREGTADEGSYETDVGPMEDITAEKSAQPEAGSHSESVGDAVVESVPGQDESNQPGRTESVAEESERAVEETVERSGQTKAAEGIVEAEPSMDAQQNVEPSPESDTVMKTTECSAETATAVDKPEVAVGNAVDNEAFEANAQVAKPGEDRAEISQQAVAEPKVSEAETPNEDNVADIPVSNPGDGEVAAEATEHDANAAVITSVPVVQEYESLCPAEKSASTPEADDPMAVETV